MVECLKVATGRHYARNPGRGVRAQQEDRASAARVVAYRVWADLRRGWRITMPNLEQTGQLLLSYAGVDELAADEAKWASVWPATVRGGTRNAQLAHADIARRAAPQHLHRIACTSPRSGTRTSSEPARNG